MTTQEAFYQSQINKLGISIYPIVIKHNSVVLVIAKHYENDIMNNVKSKQTGTITYENNCSIWTKKIRELYEILYKKQNNGK